MFKKHLDKSKVTYIGHAIWAFIAGLRLIWAGIASIIHGFIPSLFDGKAPKTIIDIYHSHLVNHPNDEYKKMIEQAKKDNE
jgi:hypothetical protein|tara:strand:- start:5704 stop:5946 length:243 start_codon:yes stop_codon:yes gene_type:complete